MNKLIKLIILLALTVWLSITLQQANAKMILAFSGWRVDMPLWVAFLLLLAILVLGSAFYQILRGVLHFPFALKNSLMQWIRNRKKPFDAVDILKNLHDPIKAEKFIRKQLKKKWQENLVKYYGELNHPDLQKLLTHAEKWLKTHAMSPGLYYTLGCLCQRLRLWGKAQRYFETSLAFVPMPETYAKLGALLEQRDQPALASENYKKGLLLTQENQEITGHA